MQLLRENLLRYLAGAFVAVGLVFAIARYGATEDASLYSFLLFLLVPILAATWRAPANHPSSSLWPALLALTGLFLFLHVALRPTLEARGYALAAIGWAGLVTGLWLGVDKRFRRGLVLLLVVVAVVEALYGLVQAIGGVDQIFDYQRKLGRVATGTFINRNHFAGFLNLAAGLALGLVVIAFGHRTGGSSHRSEKWARAWLVMLACSTLGLGVLLSLSRGGIGAFVAMGIFAGLLLFLRSRISSDRSPPPQAVALLFLATLALGALVGLGAVTERFTGDATFTRPSVHLDTVRMIGDHPWAGVGPGMFGLRFQEYQSAPEDRRVLHAHNDYLESAAEWGLPVALAFWMFMLWRLSHSVRRALATRDIEDLGLFLGSATAIFGLVLHSLVDFNLQIPVNLLAVSLIIGLSWSAEAHRRDQAPTARLRVADISSTTIRLLLAASILLAGWKTYHRAEAEYLLQTAEGVATLEAALAHDPTAHRAHAELGRARRGDTADRDLEASLSALETAVKLNPYSRAYRFSLGRTYEALGDYASAEREMIEATGGNPKNGRHFLHLASLYLRTGQRDKVWEPLKTALRTGGASLRQAPEILLRMDASPQQIDAVWPSDPSARLPLIAGIVRSLRRGEEPRYRGFLLAKWKELLDSAEPPSVDEGTFFVDSLVASGEVVTARQQWLRLAEVNALHDPSYAAAETAVWNGSFELPLTSGTFDWHRLRADDVRLRLQEGSGRDGSRGVSVEFSGATNVSLAALEQVLVVEPGATYDLRFDALGEDLTTDQGPYFELAARGLRSSLLETEMITGTTPWTTYTTTLTMPENARLVTLRLRRRPSRRIDSKIDGRLLIDNLALEPMLEDFRQ